MQVLDKLFSKASFWVPERFTSSGWIEHAPFAFWLIDAQRPRVVVELGTHNGYSFLCFCQAIKALGYPAKAFAVDSWQGDEHAGFYDQKTYDELSAHHGPRYGQFSELIRSTFDQALDKFEDGSIDLLHIDGLHFYESVRHDFETWRAKLSPRGIVLFHDTNVYERDFGVHRLWQEIEGSYPSFHFLHGNGLGVLGYGNAIAENVKPLFDAAGQHDTAEFIRSGYGRLGSAFTALQRQTELSDELGQRNADIARLLNDLKIREDQFHEFALERQRFVEAERSHVNTISALNQDLSRASSLRGTLRALPSMALRSARFRLGFGSTTLNRDEASIIRKSGLFDEAWYTAKYAEVGASGLTPVRHYLNVGVQKGYNPHCLFDGKWYAERYPAAAQSEMSPLGYYLKYGVANRHSPHPLFDTDWYLTQNPDVEADGLEPLHHYLIHGGSEARDPNPLFDTKWYLEKYSDVRNSPFNPLVHYAMEGWRENRDTHPRFIRASLKSILLPEIGSGIDPLRCALEYLTPDEISRLSGEKEPFLSDVLSDVSGHGQRERVIKYFGTIERLRDHFNADAASGLVGRGEGKDDGQFVQRSVQSLSALSKKLDDSRPVQVSIVVPVYNQLPYTIACIQAILDQASRYRYEILIGNDCSTDQTAAMLADIGGIVRVITHEKNLQFLRNCNATAEAARGKYVVFLNNDTFVLNGWLNGIIEPFERFRNVGLVGSKILMSDGTLQEAGGIVWADGSAWNYGRGTDPRLPESNYLKDVDYCSGCSIALPISLWQELGGFDLTFAPAYYEDTDIAFSLRSRGYRTLYNPRSVLIHHEGVSHGVDVESGVKAYQVENQKRFFAKWQNVLGSEHFRAGQNSLLARDRSRNKPHILIVDHYVPKFDRDTGSRTMFEYLKLFIDEGFHVVFWPHDLAYDRIYVQAAQDLGVEVIYGAEYFGKFGRWLEANHSRLKYVLLSRAHVAEAFIDDLRKWRSIKILFFGHDIHFLRMRQEQRYQDSVALRDETVASEARERKVWSLVDVVYHPADYEVAFVKREYPEAISRLFPLFMFSPEEIEDARRRAEASRAGQSPVVIFVGGFAHPPNVDAALWLVREIWPHVISKVPEALLYVAGSSPPPEISALMTTSVHVTGYISDAMLMMAYQASRVCVVPLRYGGGVKGKIIESIRFGVPVVSTTVGVQGIAGSESFIDVADQASEFADFVVRLMSNSHEATTKARSGVEFISREYSRERIRELLALDIPEFKNANEK